MKRALLLLVLVLTASTAFAQMDMLPEIFRDLPPELQLGLPPDMTYDHYRQMTRNVDFFTMFMSMFVPGYGLYQVERPGLAAGVLAGRIGATTLMGAAVVRQWSDLRDISQLQNISEEEFRAFLVNATLFGAGIFLNGMGWALDVLAAYHIAKDEKDFTLYKYGLITAVDGTNEERLRAYLRRTIVQSDDQLRLSEDLERYLRAFPEGPAAPEMAFHLGSLRAQQGRELEAFVHLARSIFAYPEHDFTRAAEQALASLIHRNRRRWYADWEELWSLVGVPVAGETSGAASRYFEFLDAIDELESRTFRLAFIEEASYYLFRFPGSPREAEVLYRLGVRAIEADDGDRAVAGLASVIYRHRRSEFYYRSILALGSYYQETLREDELAARIYRFAEPAPGRTLLDEEKAARTEASDRLRMFSS